MGLPPRVHLQTVYWNANMSTINKSYVVGVYLHLLLKSLEIGELGQQEGEQGAGEGSSRLDYFLLTFVKPSQFMLANVVESRT